MKYFIHYVALSTPEYIEDRVLTHCETGLCSLVYANRLVTNFQGKITWQPAEY